MLKKKFYYYYLYNKNDIGKKLESKLFPVPLAICFSHAYIDGFLAEQYFFTFQNKSCWSHK